MSWRVIDTEAAAARRWSLLSVVRRVVDVSLSALLLAVLTPLMLAICMAIRLDDGGPALFRQVRVGLHQRRFVMFKFRTMGAHSDASLHQAYVRELLTRTEPPDGGERGVYKLSDDPRVTRMGSFLRRTSLDELPQLLNVVRGDMSLVGPRPALDYEVDLYERRHFRRFHVRPGLTGLWQVSGRSMLSLRQALDLDIEYVRRQCLWLDARILMRTVLVVLRGFGAR